MSITRAEDCRTLTEATTPVRPQPIAGADNGREAFRRRTTTVSEINDPAQLESLASVWNELLERTPDATFFHSLDWLKVYWKHFGAGKRLRVLVVRNGDQPLGILPLVVTTPAGYEPGRAVSDPIKGLRDFYARRLAYPLGDFGDFYGPIGAEPTATLVAGLDHVRRTPRDWHFLELAWVDAQAHGDATQLAMDQAGFRAICRTHETNGFIDVAGLGSWDAYCSNRSKKWHKNLHRCEKKLTRRGRVTYVRHSTVGNAGPQADPRWDLYEACEAVSRSSWQEAAAKGNTLSKAAYRAYYRDCHLAAARAGALDISLLFVDGRPVAFDYAYPYRGFVAALKTAYDPDFAAEGAGLLVQARAYADCFDRRDHTLDLGPVEYMEYKWRWLTHTRVTNRYAYYPPGRLRAQLVRGKRALKRCLKTALRRFRPFARSAVPLTQPVLEKHGVNPCVEASSTPLDNSRDFLPSGHVCRGIVPSHQRLQPDCVGRLEMRLD